MRQMLLSNGCVFDFGNPEASMEHVTPEVIAHSLANQCRFAGQVSRFYSVAEHTLHMSMQFDDPAKAYAALMHDAHESVVQDVIRPLKTDAYRAFEDQIQALFMRKFEFEICEEVKALDDAMIAAELVRFLGAHYIPRDWSLAAPPADPFPYCRSSSGCAWDWVMQANDLRKKLGLEAI